MRRRALGSGHANFQRKWRNLLPPTPAQRVDSWEDTAPGQERGLDAEGRRSPWASVRRKAPIQRWELWERRFRFMQLEPGPWCHECHRWRGLELAACSLQRRWNWLLERAGASGVFKARKGLDSELANCRLVNVKFKA